LIVDLRQRGDAREVLQDAASELDEADPDAATKIDRALN
jgi:hypothetical protein